MENLQNFKDVMWDFFHVYEDAQRKQGNLRATLLDFSNWLGIPATTRSSIMPERGPAAYIPRDEMLDKIATKAAMLDPGLAYRLYEAADRPPRMPNDPLGKLALREFMDPRLTKDDREAILEFMRERRAARQKEEEQKEDGQKQLSYA